MKLYRVILLEINDDLQLLEEIIKLFLFLALLIFLWIIRLDFTRRLAM